MTNKVIVVTGASAGIGAALAKQLSGRGEMLVVAGRREEELKKVALECGPQALAVVADVTQRADVDRILDEALRTFGHVDVWINNAGRGISRPVLELTEADFDEMMAVNAKSALYGMQAILPHFKERGEGHLINVSSMLGRIPFVSNRSVYCAAKAALNSLTASLRMYLRADYPNIHVSLVLPPTVSTDFPRNVLHGTPPPPGGYRTGPDVQTAGQVAAAMVDLIDHPRPELYTNPGGAETVARYYADVGAFEAGMHR